MKFLNKKERKVVALKAWKTRKAKAEKRRRAALKAWRTIRSAA